MPGPVSLQNSRRLSRKPSTGTFTPKFIKNQHSSNSASRDSRSTDSARDLAEFSGKRWVWLRDEQLAFVKGWVTEDNGLTLQVRCDNETVDRTVDSRAVDKVNPPKFNLVDDMADLTYLNEASVIHNLRQRYEADLIYTYSGLFLVTVNPYRNLPIYGPDYIEMYQEKRRGDTTPHIFSTSDIAFHDMLEMRENQSILITGESGAGKTENTKKVIQYLAAIASGPQQVDNLEQQILQANPILEAFGNAQTVRNNNSSRFGKFIRIEFDYDGNIAGANIEWYLLEKSRVVFQRSDERNYHVFYQLIRGADKAIRRISPRIQKLMIEKLLLDENLDSYRYLKSSRKSVQGVNDVADFSALKNALKIMGIGPAEQMNLWKTLAAILHLGNIVITDDRSDQARIPDLAKAELACHILGIPSDDFVKALLNPRVRAGREWVNQSRTKSQALHSLDALAKALYEKSFGYLVERINQSMERPSAKTSFIGVLDIAGFEIFQTNSFEQLCINYTNEKLQQFFNHHMFVLEQEEYAREDIEWKFIDFGHDLQPTIDLIEKSNPIGILSLLDEECIMPKGSDRTFTSKVYELWDGKSKQFKPSRLRNEGFILTHYAADVEYSTEEWLSKNKDPLNDNIIGLLANSTDAHIASLFEGADSARSKQRVKKGIFRTVAQRHKEQLNSLMTQLNATQPHFVRCIIPNEKKQPRVFNGPLVLDQLRCNGVLEGIRIARTGFPNRLTFMEFRQRYELLTPGLPTGFIESRNAAQMILSSLDLDRSMYQMGRTKVFFRAGLLAELEEKRDRYMQQLFTSFQSAVRGYMQRRLAKKRLFRHEAVGIIQHNLLAYNTLCSNPWWQLYLKMKPLLTASRVAEQEKAKKAAIAAMEAKIAEEKKHAQQLEAERRRVEAEKSRLEEDLRSERALVVDTQEILRRSKQREQEMEEQLERFMAELEEADNNYDQLMDGFAESQRTVERMRAELNLGAQLVQKLQEEKVQLLEEIEEVSRDNASVAQNEEQTQHIRELEEDVAELRGSIKKLQTELRDRRMQITSLEREINDMEKDIGNLEGEKSKAQGRCRALENELRITKAQVDELLSTNLDNENVIRMKDSQIALLQDSIQQRVAEDSKSIHSRDYQEVVESNNFLEQLLEESKLAASQANEARLKAEQAKKNASDQLHILRQESEIQREDLRSAEAETKKAWKIAGEANAKSSAQTKELKEAQDTKLELSSKIAVLQRKLDELNNSSKLGSVEKNRLETEISTLSRRLKMEQEMSRRAEADLSAKSKELLEIKGQNMEFSQAKLAAMSDQKEKLEAALRDWQAKHANVASRLDASETHKSRAILEIEDLNHELARSQQIGTAAERLAANLKSMLSEAQASAKEAKYQLGQAETENSKLRQQLSTSNKDLDERTQQLLLFQRSIGVLPQNASSPGDWNALKAKTLQNLDLAKRLEEANLALQIAEEQKASLERRLQNSSNWKDDFDQPSRPQWRTIDDAARSRSREASPLRALPSRLRERTGSVSSFNSVTSRSEFDSNGSDDLSHRKHTQNLRNEIEDLTTRLELSEMQRRRLESRSSPHSHTNSSDGDSLVIELRRLQRENVRLHELVDEQAEKLSSAGSSKPATPRQTHSSPQSLEQIRSLEQAKQKLTDQQNRTLRELSNARIELDKIRAEKDAEYRKISSLKQELEAEKAARKRETNINESAKNEYKALKIRVEREAGRHAEIEDTIRMHKSRAEDLQNKLEDAEIAAHNAMRSEAFARGQLQEVEDALAAALDEQRKAEDAYINLQKDLRNLEGKFEDTAAELKSTKNRCQRLEHDLEDLHSHQDMEVKERSMSLEQTRSKYQRELEDLTKELALEREAAVKVYEEQRRLRAELEAIHAKISDEHDSGSTWAKEKSRLEVQYRLLSEKYEEAVIANRDTQGQQVALLSQNRSLRSSLEQAEAVRAQLLREKLQLENRLQNLNESDLFSVDPNSTRHPALLEKKIVDLKSELAEKQDAAATAIERMRRAELVAADAQKEIATERQSIIKLHKDKAMLEKAVNDLRMKLVDLETRSFRGDRVEGNFLARRIQDLEKELQERERELSEKGQTDRNLERQIKSLEYEVVQKEKARARLEQDLQRSDEKNAKLKQVIDEMINENTTPTKLGRFASTRSGR